MLAAERAVLLELQTKLHLKEDNDDWNDEDPCSNVRFIGCSYMSEGLESDDYRYHVNYLRLYSVRGSLPSSLRPLTRLSEILIRGLPKLEPRLNGLFPELPDSLGYLTIQDTDITGFKGLAGLPQLDTLFIPRNKMSGSLPSMSNFPRLSLFNADNNDFSGPIPSFAGASPRLTSFSVRNNKLSGPLAL